MPRPIALGAVKIKIDISIALFDLVCAYFVVEDIATRRDDSSEWRALLISAPLI